MLPFSRISEGRFQFYPFFQAAKVLGVEAEAFRRGSVEVATVDGSEIR